MKRFFLYLMLAIILLPVLIWAASPSVLKPAVNDVLSVYRVHLKDESIIRVNPFLARVSINELAVDTPENVPSFSIRNAIIDINWFQLFKGKVVFDQLEFDGIRLDIIHASDGLMIGGVNTNTVNSTSDADVNEPSKGNNTSEYHLLIPKLIVSDTRITYKDDLGEQQLYIDQLSLTDAYITPAKQIFTLLVDASINTAPVAINLSANLTEFYGPIRATVALDHFSLVSVKALIGDEINQLEGRLSASSNIELVLMDETYENIHVNALDTRIGVEDFVVDTGAYYYKTNKQIFSLNELWVKQTTGVDLEIKTGLLSLVEPSSFTLIDHSVEPAFNGNFVIKSLMTGPYDTHAPDDQSPFSLVGSDNEYANFEFNGWLKPFADKLSLAITAKVSELPLPLVSPYLADSLGLALKTGQFDSTMDITVVNEQIDGSTHIDIRGLKLDKASDFDERNLADGKALSLNSALGVLQDKQGNLSLDIPLSGNINSPGFGTRSFISLILKKAAMAKAKDYLVSTFLPYADVIKVASVAGSYALKVRIEPLVFDAGQSALVNEQYPFLEKLSQLLIKSKNKQLKICGSATAKDIQSHHSNLTASEIKQLNALSTARVKAVKQYLVEQAQIKSSRILLCTPSIAKDPTALPSIKFTMT